MKNFDFMKLIISSRHYGTREERNAYYEGKFYIDLLEGTIRNPIVKKLKQGNGGIFLV